MGGWFSSLLQLFWSKKLDLIVVGLDNAGKTTLLNIIAHGHSIETVPTLGLNVKQMRHSGIQIKLWDVGGQESYRDTWHQYAQECNCIVYVVDSADPNRLELSKRELHRLLERPQLSRLPVLIVSNKIDLPNHLPKEHIIKGLNLDYITENRIAILEISALEKTNVDKVLEWMISHAPQ